MKLFRPLRGEVLFTSPAVSIRKYEARWIKPWMKVAMTIVNFALVLTVWILLYRTTWLRALYMLAAFGVFALIVIPVMKVFVEMHPVAKLHYFYRDSMYAYTDLLRRNRGLFTTIFPDTVAGITMQEVEFENQFFRLFTVSFKDTVPRILPNFRKIKFGVPLEANLDQMEAWLKGHGLQIETVSA